MNKQFKTFFDIFVTLSIWIYFTVGYAVFLTPFCAAAFFFSKDRESAFQYLNSIFLKGFFLFLRMITPGLSYDIDNNVRSIRSAVVVSNHLSYLDPILLISLFKKHKTIVKSPFFKVPIFGWVLKTAGYIPSSAEGHLSQLMIERVGKMNDYLDSGGVLFIFPEGTRNPNGNIASFGKGAFTIAHKCKVPVKILFISNTHKLYQPGKFWFNTCVQNTIKIELTATIDGGSLSVSQLMSQVRSVLESKLNIQMQNAEYKKDSL